MASCQRWSILLQMDNKIISVNISAETNKQKNPLLFNTTLSYSDYAGGVRLQMHRNNQNSKMFRKKVSLEGVSCNLLPLPEAYALHVK